MCKCDPQIRTPFCGKVNCEWPKPATQAKLIRCPFCEDAHLDNISCNVDILKTRILLLMNEVRTAELKLDIIQSDIQSDSQNYRVVEALKNLIKEIKCIED